MADDESKEVDWIVIGEVRKKRKKRMEMVFFIFFPSRLLICNEIHEFG